MSERKCRRCGRILTEQDPEIRPEYWCEECFADFEEFCQGAPIIKWNPVRFREFTEEERHEYEQAGIETDALTITDSFMPEDGQQVLVTLRDGRMYYDTAYNDNLGYYLDSGIDWEDDVIAWAAPEPYKPEEEGGSGDGLPV